MTITLITGANRGLGRETARRLVEAGHTVYVGSRDQARGEEAARAVGGHAVRLDVTSDDSVSAAAELLTGREGRLDVLVNNAAVFGSSDPAPEVPAKDLIEVYDTNVFGAVRTLHTFLPLLRASAAPVVVNVSSGLGSLAAATDRDAHTDAVPVWLPALTYPSSKAALNMLTAQYAHALPGFRINSVDPGYTATGPTRQPGQQTVEEGAEIVVRAALSGPEGPTGRFLRAGGTAPW